jgi:hypothetical protein
MPGNPPQLKNEIQIKALPKMGTIDFTPTLSHFPAFEGLAAFCRQE